MFATEPMLSASPEQLSKTEEAIAFFRDFEIDSRKDSEPTTPEQCIALAEEKMQEAIALLGQAQKLLSDRGSKSGWVEFSRKGGKEYPFHGVCAGAKQQRKAIDNNEVAKFEADIGRGKKIGRIGRLMRSAELLCAKIAQEGLR